MEVLQYRPSNNDPPSEIHDHQHQITTEELNRRLQSIPCPPRTIEAANSYSKRESTESITATTITTASEPSSDNSTAATSVSLLPQIFTFQRFYVSPSMEVNEDIYTLWTGRIKSRLNAALLHDIPRGTCVQELLMAGKRRDKLKPTIIVTSCDTLTKKRVEKTFKAQRWLQELLKANNIMFISLVADTRLSAGSSSDDGQLMKSKQSYAIPHLPRGITTRGGLRLLVHGTDADSTRHCTLGGLLVVKGEIWGLTAGHPFNETEVSIIDATDDGGMNAARVVEEYEDKASNTDSSDPFVFNDDPDDDDDDDSASSIASPTGAQMSLNYYRESKPEQENDWRSLLSCTSLSIPRSSVLQAHGFTHDPGIDALVVGHDWALIRDLPTSEVTLPNRIPNIHQLRDSHIKGTISSSSGGEVIITVAGMGPRLGYLHPSTGSMKVDKTLLDVQLVTLERVLRTSSSTLVATSI